MKRSNIALSAVLFGVLTGVAHADPVGMACHIKGKPEVRTGGHWRALKTLQKLEPGDVVRCSGGEEAIVVLFGNGQRFRVGAGRQATVSAAALTGAQSLGGAGNPSSRVARALSGARVGAVMARPAASHQRLTPEFPGWIVPEAENRVRLDWTAVSGAATYSVSLLDWNDDVVWNGRIDGSETSAVAEIPSLQLRRAYVWRLLPLGKSGKPVASLRWGVVTFLSRADADALQAEVTPLEAQAKQEIPDATARALLAELYRSYGVHGRTLEKLEELSMLGQPGAVEAQSEAYQQIGPYAYGRWLIVSADKQRQISM
ncbi:MAG TPA: hypothetical protein VF681_10395 [Abditibacteriaceae bacterium]